MLAETYKWNYDYVTLAYDNGFSFNKNRSNSFDKNKFCLIDIDHIIQEKDVASVDKFIPCISEFVLDPEQAQILDDHFVKIFRLSQLTIEYLLFCKRFLDKSLVEFKEECEKLKKENKELNLFVDDLKQHISVLMKEIKKENTTGLFKCEYCNKLFSTEEFLKSHVKRRHNQNTVPTLQLETDQLHTEIKELKGRLNSAEKLIQKDQGDVKTIHEINSSLQVSDIKKIDDLQQKFEDLRVQVQSELKVLQTQYNFQEKYEKLFEKMTFQNAKIQMNNKDDIRDSIKKKESTTQTEKEVNITEVEVKNKENISDLTNTHKQVSEFEEAIEVKVSSSLGKIEQQMQSFWNKLHEMDMNKQTPCDQKNDENQEVPVIKPRSKYTMKKTHSNLHKELGEAKSTKVILVNEDKKDKSEQIQGKSETSIDQPIENTEKKIQLSSFEDSDKKTLFSKESLSDTEPESVATSNHVQLKCSRLDAKRNYSSNSVSKKSQVNPELFDHFKDEVEKIMVVGRLQDLGVSPEWKGLPTHSFQRAMEIVNHKANLMKKSYQHFDKISVQIEQNINKKVSEMFGTNKTEKRITKPNLKHKKKMASSVSKKDRTELQIKNRKMYETDSDCEPVKVITVHENLKNFSSPYSAVIEELKSVTTKYESSDKSVSDGNSIKEEHMKNEETKGVLRNYPSVGSMIKKKVLFNLKDDKSSGKTTIREGESTTSITSSVLDCSPKKAKMEKDIEEEDIDYSDLDF